MIELLSTYSLSEIAAFIVAFALAVKGFVSFWDWGFERLKKVFNKEAQSEKERENLEKQIQELKELNEKISYDQTELQRLLKEMQEDISLLKESDKEGIKDYLVKEHHFFCYQQKWIDVYSLERLEKRFSYYSAEGGNSFIENFMEELRELPRSAASVPTYTDDKYIEEL